MTCPVRDKEEHPSGGLEQTQLKSEAKDAPTTPSHSNGFNKALYASNPLNKPTSRIRSVASEKMAQSYPPRPKESLPQVGLRQFYFRGALTLPEQ